jgi:glycine C-acetyltransferase
LQALDLLSTSSALRDRLAENARYFRQRLAALGFDIHPGEHPIVPIMLGEAALAQQMANRLLELGVYVIGFSYPVVPKGQARIRVQLSAAHQRADLETALTAFKQVGSELGVLE